LTLPLTESPVRAPMMTAPAAAVVEAPVAAPAAENFGLAFGLSAAIAVAGVAVWGILAGMAHMRLALVGFGVAQRSRP